MTLREFENFLTANSWIRVNNETYRSPELYLTISNKKQVYIYRAGSTKCVFDMLLKDAEITSEAIITVHKDDKEYKVPFRKDALKIC